MCRVCPVHVDKCMNVQWLDRSTVVRKPHWTAVHKPATLLHYSRQISTFTDDGGRSRQERITGEISLPPSGAVSKSFLVFEETVEEEPDLGLDLVKLGADLSLVNRLHGRHINQGLVRTRPGGGGGQRLEHLGRTGGLGARLHGLVKAPCANQSMHTKREAEDERNDTLRGQSCAVAPNGQCGLRADARGIL